MMALFGGIAHAPLAVMLMVAEMTGNLSLLAPAMIAVAVSTALVGDTTIYRSQLPNRAYSPAHRVRFSFPLLSALLVRDAPLRPAPTAPADAPLSAAAPYLDAGDMAGVVALGAHGEVIGTLTREQVEAAPPAARAGAPLRALLNGPPLVLGPDETMDVALEKLTERGASWAPVVDNGRLLGRLLARDIIGTYKDTLQRSVRRATALTADTVLFEARLSPNSPLAGKALREAGLPRNTLVVSIARDGSTMFPRADTRLAAGDVIMVMAEPRSEQALRTFLEGTSCLLPPAPAPLAAPP